MRYNIKQQLDSEERNRKFVKVFYFILPVVVMALIASFVFNRGETESSFVIGEVVNRHTRLHEEGHTNYLLVKVSTEKELVKVRVPNRGIVKTNTKVQLRRIMAVSSGKSRYVFVKYIE